MGCSGKHLYQPSSSSKNLQISIFEKGKPVTPNKDINLNIFVIDNNSKLIYLGTVDLQKKDVFLSLPINKKLALDVEFKEWLFGGGESSTVERHTLFTKAKKKYQLKINYFKNFYDIKLLKK